MQTTRIHFEDQSTLDIRVSDLQTEEFRRWLRFANRNDTYKVFSYFSGYSAEQV